MSEFWNELKDLLIAPAVLLLGWLGSFEYRLRDKVGHKEFDRLNLDLKNQSQRIESHMWQIMCAMNVQPNMDPPEDVKNGNECKKEEKFEQ